MIKKPRHKWKPLSGKPVKGQIEAKTCTKCGVQVRRVRKGSTKPHGGWVEVFFRKGPNHDWESTRRGWGSRVPDCAPTPICMTCNGTGRYPDEEKYRHMPYVSCCPDQDCKTCTTPE